MMTVKDFVDKILIITRQTEYARSALTEYVNMGIDEMLTSGVAKSVAYSSKALGFLASYCVDMDSPNAGNIKMSEYTKKKLIQLTMLAHDKYEEIKYGALLVNFNCEDNIEMTLNIYQNEELKFAYRINKAIVEILEVGSYKVELIAPDKYIVDVSEQDVLVEENKVAEIYEKILREEENGSDVTFSCKNAFGQCLPGFVFTFKNVTNNKVVGTYTTQSETISFKIPSGLYLITSNYVPHGYESVDSKYFTVKDNSVNDIEMIAKIGESSTITYGMLINSFSPFSTPSLRIGLEPILRGVWSVQNKATKEYVFYKECDENNTFSNIKVSLVKNIEYLNKFVPTSPYMQEYEYTYKFNGSTYAWNISTIEGYGTVKLNSYLSSKVLSASNGKDITKYTIRFTNMDTGEITTETVAVAYTYLNDSNVQTSSISASAMVILKAGTYKAEVIDVEATTNNYEATNGEFSLVVNSKANTAVTLNFQTI